MTKAELIEISTSLEKKHLYSIRQAMIKDALMEKRETKYFRIGCLMNQDEIDAMTAYVNNIKTTLEGEGYTVAFELIEAQTNPASHKIEITIEW